MIPARRAGSQRHPSPARKGPRSMRPSRRHRTETERHVGVDQRSRRRESRRCNLDPMARRTLLGAMWDRQDAIRTVDASTFVRGESGDPGGRPPVNPPRPAPPRPRPEPKPPSTAVRAEAVGAGRVTEVRGEGPSTPSPQPPPAQPPSSPSEPVTKVRGEGALRPDTETRVRGEGTG